MQLLTQNSKMKKPSQDDLTVVTAVIISTHFNNLISIYGQDIVQDIEYFILRPDNIEHDSEFYAGRKALGGSQAVARVLHNLICTYPDFDYYSLIKDGYSKKVG